MQNKNKDTRIGQNRRKRAKEEFKKHMQMLRHTHSHTGKSHKNRKPENIVYTQKTYKVKEKNL